MPNIRTLLLSEVLSEFKPAYGDTWEGAWKLLSEDHYDLEVVEALENYLRENGTFIEPVVLDWEDMVISNGMHRLCAATRAGVHSVLTADGFPEYDEETPWVEVEFTLHHGDTVLDAEEAMDLSMGLLRSFMGPTGWLNCDTFASFGGPEPTIVAAWEWPHEEADSLSEIIVKRAAEKGYVLTPISVKPLEL